MRQVDGYPLWLGHIGDTRTPGDLYAAGIEAVVELAANESPANLPREFVHCRFPLVDGAGNAPRLLRAAIEAVASLLELQVPTLVCCGVGMSRTPAVAAAALAKTTTISLSDALELVTRDRPADISTALWAEIQAVIG
jgi:protein-tyrosine phosphatase